MDKFLSYAGGIGIPALILKAAMLANPHHGGASYLTALKAIGPGGIKGGLATLLVSGLVSKEFIDNIISVALSSHVKALYLQGTSETEIFKKIESWPISYELQCQLRELFPRIEHELAQDNALHITA